MTDNNERRPTCFADLAIVFPLGSDGLRHTPRGCMICVYKTECLREAMSCTQGFTVREEAVDRAYRSGAIGFWDRWSRKKSLHRKRQAAGREARGTKQPGEDS